MRKCPVEQDQGVTYGHEGLDAGGHRQPRGSQGRCLDRGRERMDQMKQTEPWGSLLSF